MEDPFALKIKDLSRLADATIILNALRGNDLYDGDPVKLAIYQPEDLMKIRGLGTKRVALIAKALESIGVIGDAEEWLKGDGQDCSFKSGVLPHIDNRLF